MAELATKLDFTSAAVAEFFKILGDNVPKEKVPARLIEIATRFAQLVSRPCGARPDDPHVAELVRQATEAFGARGVWPKRSLVERAQKTRRWRRSARRAGSWKERRKR